MDINLDIPSFSQSGATHNLIDLFTEYFKTDQIEDYHCIKCSIRTYLLQSMTINDREKIIRNDDILV